MKALARWISRNLHEAFGSKSLAFILMAAPLSCLYLLISVLRNRAFDFGILKTARLPGKVIALGNLTVGGTGKTPFAEALARELKRHGKVVILSRGYGADLRKGETLVLMGNEVLQASRDFRSLPDEAAMLASKLRDVPVAVSTNRWDAAQAFLRTGRSVPDYWLLDDGFQHRKLARDVDVLLIRPHTLSRSYRQMLPLGPWRESLRAVRRASIVCFTKVDAALDLSREEEQIRSARAALKPCPIFKVPYEVAWPVHPDSHEALPRLDVHVAKPKFHLICGIADPEHLKGSLSTLGIVLEAAHVFGDHEAIPPFFLSALPPDALLLTTEKDLSRSRAAFLPRIAQTYIIPFRAHLSEDCIQAIVDADESFPI